MKDPVLRYEKHRQQAAKSLFAGGQRSWKNRSEEEKKLHEQQIALALYHKFLKDKQRMLSHPNYSQDKTMQRAVATIDKRLPRLSKGKYHHFLVHG